MAGGEGEEDYGGGLEGGWELGDGGWSGEGGFLWVMRWEGKDDRGRMRGGNLAGCLFVVFEVLMGG